MPSNEEHRVVVSFGRRLDILELIREDAEREELPESYFVRRACIFYYEQRKQEAEIFKNRSRAEKRDGVPVLETLTPQELAAQRAEEVRRKHGLEKS